VVYIEVENRPIWDAQWLDVDVLRYFAEIGMVPIMRDLQRDFQYNLVFVSERLAGEPWVADLAAGVYRPSRVNVTNPERVLTDDWHDSRDCSGVASRRRTTRCVDRTVASANRTDASVASWVEPLSRAAAQDHR
jgi:hypothetical protein